MTWIIYLFGSGFLFFLGIGFVLVGLATFVCCRPPRLKSLASLCVFTGLLFIVFSATPLPYWFYLLALTGTFLWLVAERNEAGFLIARRNWLRGLVVVVWAIAVILEVP